MKTYIIQYKTPGKPGTSACIVHGDSVYHAASRLHEEYATAEIVQIELFNGKVIA